MLIDIPFRLWFGGADRYDRQLSPNIAVQMQEMLRCWDLCSKRFGTTIVAISYRDPVWSGVEQSAGPLFDDDRSATCVVG